MAPTITAECGQMGNPAGAERAFRLLDALLHLIRFPTERPGHEDLVLYRCLGRILVAPQAAIHVGEERRHGLSLRPDLEHLNFTAVRWHPAGHMRGIHLDRLGARWRGGRCGTYRAGIPAVRHGRLIVTREFTPAMLTLHERLSAVIA